MSQYWKLGFPNFPFFEVRILLLRNIIAAKPMVRFGCPKHQKVYQGHKKVPCEFRTWPHSSPDSAQLAHCTSSKKWQPFAPHQPPKNRKTCFDFLRGGWGAKGCHFLFEAPWGSWGESGAYWAWVQNSQGTILWPWYTFLCFGKSNWTIGLVAMMFWSNKTQTSKMGNMRNWLNQLRMDKNL